MITKFLFTAAIIGLVYLAMRTRARRTEVMARERLPAPGAPQTLETARFPRIAAYAFLVLMFLGSGLFLFLQWQDEYRVVTVRVVNTNTGQAVSFQARRGNVAERSFETLDGRRVVLAEVERLELGQ